MVGIWTWTYRRGEVTCVEALSEEGSLSVVGSCGRREL